MKSGPLRYFVDAREAVLRDMPLSSDGYFLALESIRLSLGFQRRGGLCEESGSLFGRIFGSERISQVEGGESGLTILKKAAEYSSQSMVERHVLGFNWVD